ncbi:putative quinol monooxygenase [Lactococcus petauri]|uniref:putative quinol monooxygenase n=1 Tax=Lactococcus petauri TaxID=1940789 RepID=UPI00254C027E|nr:putative quinol monooxygenase [Lactococcus petauri]
MIIVNAKFFIKDEKREEFLKDIKELIATSKQEEGCLAYDLYEAVLSTNEFVMIENWASLETIEKHNTNPLLLAFAQNITNYSVKKPELQIVEKGVK